MFRKLWKSFLVLIGIRKKKINIMDSLPKDGSIKNIYEILTISNNMLYEINDLKDIVNKNEFNVLEDVNDSLIDVIQRIKSETYNDFDEIKNEFNDNTLNNIIFRIKNETKIKINFHDLN